MKLKAFEIGKPAFYVMQVLPLTGGVNRVFPQPFTTQLEADLFSRKQSPAFNYLTVQVVNGLMAGTAKAPAVPMLITRPQIAPKAQLEQAYKPKPCNTNKQGRDGLTASEHAAKTLLRKK